MRLGALLWMLLSCRSCWKQSEWRNESGKDSNRRTPASTVGRTKCLKSGRPSFFLSFVVARFTVRVREGWPSLRNLDHPYSLRRQGLHPPPGGVSVVTDFSRYHLTRLGAQKARHRDQDLPDWSDSNSPSTPGNQYLDVGKSEYSKPCGQHGDKCSLLSTSWPPSDWPNFWSVPNAPSGPLTFDVGARPQAAMLGGRGISLSYAFLWMGLRCRPDYHHPKLRGQSPYAAR